MAHVRVFYDEVGNTLTVWFGDPGTEHICEETGEEVILMKDKTGTVIGFEKLNYMKYSSSRVNHPTPAEHRGTENQSESPSWQTQTLCEISAS